VLNYCESQTERLVIETALDIHGVNETGVATCGASSGRESTKVGDGRRSLCSASTKSKGIVGMALDLLAAVHGGGDKEVISGSSCRVEGGEGGSGRDLEF
jgi:hypothetical protein